MKPTNKLRFVEREIQMHPFYKGADGTSFSYQYYRVLQQWWEQDHKMNFGWGEVEIGKAKGEWRDVPLEKE